MTGYLCFIEIIYTSDIDASLKDMNTQLNTKHPELTDCI